jgi:RNA-directed DNA polymerase
MLDNIPMDRVVLKKWLQSGYVEDDRLYPSRKGTPQGGIISPTLANITLDGLEEVVKNAVPRRSRVNFTRYADDFIVTGKSKRLLEEKVKPAVEAFLDERGLSLSEEKTLITHITDGFTFLGQTFRKTGNVLHITPAKKGVLALKQKILELIQKHVSAPLEPLVKKLNQTLRGWGNYHRHVVSSEAFSLIDTFVFEQLWKMIRKRHRKKSSDWLANHYWTHGKRRWIFTVRSKKKKVPCIYQVIRLSSLGIKRYIKIKADANPYDPEYARYFWRRRKHRESRFLPALSAREYRLSKAA